jgi:hypothetical protein
MVRLPKRGSLSFGNSGPDRFVFLHCEIITPDRQNVILTIEKWRIENGEWKLEIRDWRLEIGDWEMENREWRIENREWKLEIGDWRLEIGKWRMEH